MTRLPHPCLAALVLLAGPALAGAQEPVPPIRIGLIAPLTGGTAAQGKAIRDGVTLAVAEINRKGGVLGRTLELLERDDRSNNETGARVADELTATQTVVAAIGYGNTGAALAGEWHFEETEIPLVVTAATGTLITRQFAPPEYAENYVFRIAANDTLQAQMIADEAIRRGFTRIAVLHDTTTYGTLGRADITAALLAHGITPVAVEKFNIGDVDMIPQLSRARAAGAEVLVTYGIGPELAQITQCRAEIGWAAPLIGTWTLSMESFIDGAGSNGDGATMPQTFIEDPDTPRRKEFLDALHAAIGKTRISTPPAAAQSYDAVYLLASAIEQAHSTEGPRIRAALEDLQKPVDGVLMTYDHPFSPTDHEAVKRANVVFGIVRRGAVRRLDHSAP